MDQYRKVVLLLESDPKVLTVPIIGMYVVPSLPDSLAFYAVLDVMLSPRGLPLLSFVPVLTCGEWSRGC